MNAAGESFPVSRRFLPFGFLAATSALILTCGCRGGPTAVFTELTEARRLAADLRIQFNKASDAANRAVMADTDEVSIEFAREAEQTKRLVASDLATLTPILRALGYAVEIKSLEEFAHHFGEYEKLDQRILEAAVENTNLKAQRLAFGPAREAADGLREALDTLASSMTAGDRCRVDPIVARIVLAVREIQILQGPHIAEADDAAMTKMEAQMAALGVTARSSITTLRGLVSPDGREQLQKAIASLDRFDAVSIDLLKLSRRNSNVRSLELSLRQKPTLTAACDHSLLALQDALAQETFSATR